MNEPQYKPITGMINVNDIQEILENNRYYQEEIERLNNDYLEMKDNFRTANDEIERLNKGYCELKEKCNKGDCDCTKEEYNSMCEANIKLYLEVDKLNKIIEIKTNRIQDLMNRLSKRTERIDKAIEYIETHQLNFKKNTTTFGSERLSMEERKLLDILRGFDKDDS